MNTDQQDDLEVITGTVKWFDPVRGFGFIEAEACDQDVLLHANVLRNFGQSSIADGAEVECAIQSTERGIQAVELYHVTPPKNSGVEGLEDIEDLENLDLEAIPYEPARIKWFDKAKGFGFANVFGDDRDIFVHIEILRHCGLAELMPGEAVAVQVIDGSRGRMAVRVATWDSRINVAAD